LVFFAPLRGAAVGAAMGATLAGREEALGEDAPVLNAKTILNTNNKANAINETDAISLFRFSAPTFT
jgi:uncharacterized membrane protein